ncbi:MAG: hypothetical protein FD187_1614 [bacterium]|nr:MAG: hypothetical protein FD142_1981 [bacterium]KAF0148819.1 MAG: hypothetical protein FD187_1614 [bacterium]
MHRQPWGAERGWGVRETGMTFLMKGVIAKSCPSVKNDLDDGQQLHVAHAEQEGREGDQGIDEGPHE